MKFSLTDTQRSEIKREWEEGMGNAGRKCQKRVRSLIADADTSNCYADELTICGAGVEINFKSVSRSNRTEAILGLSVCLSAG